ncbi:MAG: hypothetical protein ACHP9Z_32850 [Streptosporangiales bacterium]
MAVRHAMLVIARAVFDLVEIPGQQPLVVARDTGDEAARAWWEENVRPAAAAVSGRSGDGWERKLAEWQAATRVEVGKERLHEGGPRVDVARIAFPDGTDAVADPDTAHDFITQEFRARFPAPTVAAQFADWRETVVVGDLHTWVGWLFSGADEMPVDIGLPRSQFGYPIREVLSCLDRLALDGWQIVQVSEDRTAHLDGRPGHPDGDPAAEPGVGVVRYLLSRTA